MVTGTVIYPLIRRLLPLHTTLNRNYGPFPSWARSHHRLCKLRSRIPGKGLPHGIQTLQIDFCGLVSLCEIPPFSRMMCGRRGRSRGSRHHHESASRRRSPYLDLLLTIDYGVPRLPMDTIPTLPCLDWRKPVSWVTVIL